MVNTALRISKQELSNLTPAGKVKMNAFLQNNDYIDVVIDTEGYRIVVVEKSAENLLRQYLGENRYNKEALKKMSVEQLWQEIKDMLKGK